MRTALYSAALAGCALPCVAAAQAGPHADARAVAQSHAELATRYYDERNFAGALEQLRRAEALMEGDPAVARIRFNIARCLEEMGRPAEAAAAYEAYLTLPDEGTRRVKAEATLSLLRATKLGRLVVRCHPEDADVTAEPQGAEAFSLGCPVDREHAAGTYTIVVRRAGYVEDRRGVALDPAALRELRVALTPATTPPPPPPPPEPSLRASGPEPTEPATSPWPWVTLSAGGATILGGVVLHRMTTAARAEAAGSVPGTSDRTDRTARFESLRTGMFVGYGLGAALLGAGLWWVLSDDGTGTVSATGLAPAPGGLEVRF